MRKFLLKISYTVLPLWLSIVTLVIFYNVHVIPNMQGDLGGLGKIPTKLFYERDSDTTIPNTLICTVTKAEMLCKDSFDVITCGDSFSQQGKYGYQNYMATDGLQVANYSGCFLHNPFQVAFNLMRSGYIDSTNTKLLVIESVERYLLSRLHSLSFNQVSIIEENEKPSKPEAKCLLAEAKIYLDFLLGLDIEENPVKLLKLDNYFFSGSKGDRLYFYYEDISYDEFSIPERDDSIIRSKIDTLFAEAKANNIQLLILVCPDKYDLYQDHIINNSYPIKTINEDFRRIVGDRADVIIGKELLYPHIHSVKKDMYYLDDTHWSYKSAKIIADNILRVYELIERQGPLSR